MKKLLLKITLGIMLLTGVFGVPQLDVNKTADGEELVLTPQAYDPGDGRP